MSDTTRWPVYTTKLAVLLDLLQACNAGPDAISNIKERLTNTGNANIALWADKGSYIGPPNAVSSTNAPTDTGNVRWPIFSVVSEVTAALDKAVGGGAPAIADIAERLSRSDTSTWNS